MVKFLKRISERHSKLGKGRKKKQRWRKPRGRDNKMREKRKGYPKVVSIGYKKNENIRGNINNKKLVEIKNLSDLDKMKSGETGFLKKMGKKKKLEIIKKMKDKKLNLYSININKFLKKYEKIKKDEKEDKSKKTNLDEKSVLKNKQDKSKKLKDKNETK
jgi:large subunit ribosomal protein L32e